MIKNFSYSQMSEFKSCRFSWDLKYRKGIVSKRKDTKLLIGTGIHDALEHYYSPNSPRTKEVLIDSFKIWADEQISMINENNGGNMFKEEIDELKAIKILGVEMLEGYYDFAQKNDNFKIVSTEEYFTVPIIKPDGKPYKGRYFGFKMDGIAYDENGKYWILEHKTAAGIPSNDEFLLLDEQCSNYIWAAEKKFNIQFEGVLYNVLSKQTPQVPALLKNGTTSKAWIVSTYDMFLNTLKERNENPEDFKEILDKLKNQDERFFFRTKVYRNRDEIKNVGEDLFYIAYDMCNTPHIYRHTKRECTNFCEYKAICMAMMDGSDVEFILKKNFERR